MDIDKIFNQDGIQEFIKITRINVTFKSNLKNFTLDNLYDSMPLSKDGIQMIKTTKKFRSLPKNDISNSNKKYLINFEKGKLRGFHNLINLYYESIIVKLFVNGAIMINGNYDKLIFNKVINHLNNLLKTQFDTIGINNGHVSCFNYEFATKPNKDFPKNILSINKMMQYPKYNVRIIGNIILLKYDKQNICIYNNRINCSLCKSSSELNEFITFIQDNVEIVKNNTDTNLNNNDLYHDYSFDICI